MKPLLPPDAPRILVAPLDWGLGHATRCIPIINALLTAGCSVTLAGAGPSGTLLKTTFPHLSFLPLKGYPIRYAATRMGTIARLLQQVPRLLRAIREEKKWLEEVLEDYRFDAVIADNRYGLHSRKAFCILITHQLQIQTPFGWAGHAVVQKLNYRLVRRFDACWVPDAEGPENLSGRLGHPPVLPPVPLTYIGPLTRFRSPEAPVLPLYLLVLLSGPEPQRSILERRVLEQLQHYRQPVLLIRGLPGHTGLPPVPYHITVVNHLPSETLQMALAAASFVVARAGYSTVMDLLALHKKGILVPTPGQTEQEYLARHLMKHNLAFCVPQNKFQLRNALALAGTFPYSTPSFTSGHALADAVAALLQQLRSRKA